MGPFENALTGLSFRFGFRELFGRRCSPFFRDFMKEAINASRGYKESAGIGISLAPTALLGMP
jgi:hypothetical protein